MAIFNENYIKEYNEKKNKLKNTNESVLGTLGIIGLVLLSPYIVAFAVIIIFLGIDSIENYNFDRMINKYPMLKKSLYNLINKVKDIFYKNCSPKLKYLKLQDNFRKTTINKYNTKINKKNSTATYKSYIYHIPILDQIENIISKDLAEYLCYNEDYGYIYFNETDEEFIKLKEENPDKAKKIEEEYDSLINIINTDINTVKEIILAIDEELENQPNGNIIKLVYIEGTTLGYAIDSNNSYYSYKDDNIIQESIFINVEIYINNIKMTDEIKAKVEELKAKSGKYFRR